MKKLQPAARSFESRTVRTVDGSAPRSPFMQGQVGHTLVWGKTGSGKSRLLCEILFADHDSMKE